MNTRFLHKSFLFFVVLFYLLLGLPQQSYAFGNSTFHSKISKSDPVSCIGKSFNNAELPFNKHCGHSEHNLPLENNENNDDESKKNDLSSLENNYFNTIVVLIPKKFDILFYTNQKIEKPRIFILNHSWKFHL